MGTNSISHHAKWVNLGNITAAATDHAVTARGVATVEAVTGELTLKPGVLVPYAVLFRFRSDGSEDVDSVLQVYAARGDGDHYHKVAQLTVVQGQQLDTGSIYFVDTITPASEDALFDGEESNIANHIAHYYMRWFGCDRLSFICTDLDSTTVYIDYCLLYE
jgi:hypothetical protein